MIIACARMAVHVAPAAALAVKVFYSFHLN